MLRLPPSRRLLRPAIPLTRGPAGRPPLRPPPLGTGPAGGRLPTSAPRAATARSTPPPPATARRRRPPRPVPRSASPAPTPRPAVPAGHARWRRGRERGRWPEPDRAGGRATGAPRALSFPGAGQGDRGKGRPEVVPAGWVRVRLPTGPT